MSSLVIVYVIFLWSSFLITFFIFIVYLDLRSKINTNLSLKKLNNTKVRNYRKYFYIFLLESHLWLYLYFKFFFFLLTVLTGVYFILSIIVINIFSANSQLIIFNFFNSFLIFFFLFFLFCIEIIKFNIKKSNYLPRFYKFLNFIFFVYLFFIVSSIFLSVTINQGYLIFSIIRIIKISLLQFLLAQKFSISPFTYTWRDRRFFEEFFLSFKTGYFWLDCYYLYYLFLILMFFTLFLTLLLFLCFRNFSINIKTDVLEASKKRILVLLSVIVVLKIVVIIICLLV